MSEDNGDLNGVENTWKLPPEHFQTEYCVRHVV